MFKIEGTNLKAGKFIGNKTTIVIIIVSIMAALAIGMSTSWSIAIPLMVAILTATLAMNAVVIIPTVYFGIPTRFKKRIKEYGPIKEGLSLVFPIIDDLLPENLKSRKLVTKEIKALALSQDKLGVTIEGSVQYRPDDINTYIEMDESTIAGGMGDAVESEVGRICGTKLADAFIQNRAQIELLIQCVLRLKRVPHHYVNIRSLADMDEEISDLRQKGKKILENAGLDDGNAEKRITRLTATEEKCGKRLVMGIVLEELSDKEFFNEIKGEIGGDKIRHYAEKLSPEKWVIEGEEVPTPPKTENGTDNQADFVLDVDKVAFYRDNPDRISLLLEIENELEDRKSHVEKLYGIKVESFRLSKLNFSESAQKAFEEKRSARAKMEAADTRLRKKIDMLKAYLDAGLSPTEAVNMVETTAGVDGISRQIVSVEGSKSGDLLPFAKILAGDKGGKK